MKRLLSLSLMLLMGSQASAKLVSEYSQEELRQIVGGYPGCSISQKENGETTEFRLVSVPTEDGSFAYFVEISQTGEEKTVLHLEKTHLILGGYKFKASENTLGLGWSIEASAIFLNGTIFTLSKATNGWLGESFESSAACE